MARPLTLTELKPGKAVGAHKGFAETFNWMRRFIENLSGGPGVTIDRTNEDHPVIRAEVKAVATESNCFHFGGLTITDIQPATAGTEATQAKVVVDGGAVQLGGYTYFVSGITTGDEITISKTGLELICVKIKLSDGTGDFVHYAATGSTQATARTTVTATLHAAQDDMDYYIFPIYEIWDGAKSVDYRPLPNAGCWETAPSSSSST